jgi:hypothetical protein
MAMTIKHELFIITVLVAATVAAAHVFEGTSLDLAAFQQFLLNRG